MTQSLYDELQKELDYCKTTRTAEVEKMIHEARLLGDLCENEAYKEAREAKHCLHSRIEEIEEILRLAVIVEESAVDGDVL